MEDCSKEMKVDGMGTYPFTKTDERLFFKITPEGRPSKPNVLYWPYNCYLLGLNEAPSVRNIMVEKGCPVRGQMTMTMDAINPVKVGFVLSHLVGSKLIQETMYIKCEIAECTSVNNCPRNHCGVNGRTDARKEWTQPLLTAQSKGYLYLENYRQVTPPVVPIETSDEMHAEECRTKMNELRNQCGMYVNELLLFPDYLKK